MKKQKNNSIIVRDKAVFFHKVDQNLLRKKQIKFRLKDPNWQITNEQYHRQNWRKVFSQMKQSMAQYLKLDENRHPQMIKNIQHIAFSNLKSLVLSNNNLDNIQAICLLNCQKLQFLGISHNNICSIDCLHKLSKPFLQFLSISKNPISNINNLSKIYTDKCNWFFLYLQQYEQNNLSDGYETPISQDLSIMQKLNFSIPNKLYILSEKRIIQYKLRDKSYYDLVNYICYM